MKNRLLALKIDVDTFRGTKEGVPRLIEILKKYEANATFLWSLGKDHTGRAIKRIFRPGFMKKVSRTSVLEHYGLKTLLYGTLLPGPNIAKRCQNIMRMVANEGFEVGMHTYDHIRWQDNVAHQEANWTKNELQLGIDTFESIFGYKPQVHGAAGWQMNRDAYRLEQQLGFLYASDTRGQHPFWPVCQGELVRCMQLPSTLPTLDELIGREDWSSDNVHHHLLQLTQTSLSTGHVYTLHAELEGMKLLPVFEKLLKGWKSQGYQLVSLETLYQGLDQDLVPYHEVYDGEVEGRSGKLACQGRDFLPEGQA